MDLKNIAIVSSNCQLIEDVVKGIDDGQINVLSFPSYSEFVELNHPKDIDVVLLDIDGPNMSVVNSMKIWKHQMKQFNGEVPSLLLLSKAEDIDTIMLCKSFGNTDIIFTPYSLQLIKSYHQIMTLSRNYIKGNGENPDNTQFSGEKSLPEDSLKEELSKISHELEAENSSLKNKVDTFLWKHLRQYKFPSIPAMKNVKEENDKLLQYEFKGHIGEHKYGFIREAYSNEISSAVVAKIYRKDKFTDIDEIEKLDAKLKIIVNLQHPNILKVIGIEHTLNSIYVFQEYLSGGNLRNYIEKNDRIREDDIRRIFGQIVAAIEYIHSRRICHRDLRPESISFDEFGNIRVCNFSNATKYMPGTSLKQVCGWPGYIAPEILLGEQYDGMMADIYSLGCILLDLVVGESNDTKFPQDITEPEEFCFRIRGFLEHPSLNDYSPSLNDLLSHLLAYDKNSRFPSSSITKHLFFSTKLFPAPISSKPSTPAIQTVVRSTPPSRNLSATGSRNSNIQMQRVPSRRNMTFTTESSTLPLLQINNCLK